jgi:GGDEF domain-containing protein
MPRKWNTLVWSTIQEGIKSSEDLSLFSVDLDNFPVVNDFWVLMDLMYFDLMEFILVTLILN